MRVLSSLKARPLGASQPASRALTCSAWSLVWHNATRSSAYLISTGEPGTVFPASCRCAGSGPRRPAPSRAGRRSSSTGLITPPWGVPSSVGANRPFSTTPAFSHPRSVPARGTCRAGRGCGRGRFGRMPPPGLRRAPTAAAGSSPWRVEDGLDRVVAATARPKSVGLRLEPRLPLGFQRVDDPAWRHRSAITGMPSGRCFRCCLRDVHPLDGLGRATARRRAAPSRPARPWPPGSQHHLAVDARRHAASVELRHPPHAQQRVRA